MRLRYALLCHVIHFRRSFSRFWVPWKSPNTNAYTTINRHNKISFCDFTKTTTNKINNNKNNKNKMVVYFDDKYKMPSWIAFYDHDLHLLNEEHEGFRLDADEFCGLDFTLLKFEQNYWPKLKQDPNFITAGIKKATTSQKKTIFLRLVESARRYRDQNRKPTDEEIAAAVAEGAARDDVLAQLQLDAVTLRDSLQDAEAKLIANQKLVDKFEGKYQKYKEQAKEKKVEIKEKNVVISELKGQVTALEEVTKTDDQLRLLAGKNLIKRDQPEKVFDFLSANDKLEDEKSRFDSSMKQTGKIFGKTLDALVKTKGKASDITSSLCEINKKSNTVPQEVHDEATAENASLKAKVAELTKQLQKNKADLQRSLDEKNLRVEELTNRLMITQQECEKQMWDNNKSTKEVAVLKTGRDTLMMHGIESEVKLAQLDADNGHLQSDLTSANSRTAAEKEERRKSREGHLKTKSILQDENTALKQKLSVQSEDRRNSSEGHQKAKSQLQEKVTMLQQQVTDYEALLKSAESGVGDDEKAEE
mmetsp:Transcript_61124/g.68364  ORF Transcript_61124/g.68364 Transcript_61124/m.68364 type:complete len:533 (+) Transcript_61124:497-2095(+)